MQTSFSELKYASKKRLMWSFFLAEIESVTPWAILKKMLAQFYPSSGCRGRPQVGLGQVLRMYVAQQCFSLSDEWIENDRA